MTSNQKHAAELAEQLLNGEIEPKDLKDADWALILLAAGMHRADLPVRLIAARVLTNASKRRGFFQDRDSEDRSAKPASRRVADRSRRTSALVMIVDDHRDTCVALERVLRRSGHETVSEQSASRALELARKVKPDLVIVDWVMPELNGLDLMRALRAEPATRSTPVVMCTCRDEPDDVVLARDAGASDYWVKGLVDYVSIKERVSKILDRFSVV